MNRRILGTAAAVLVLIGGCTWVKLTPEGDRVRVLDASEVSNCKQLGETKVSLMARVAGYNRDPRQVQRELDALARNAAADIGGDAVVPLGNPHEGKQTFAVYKCAGGP